LPLGKTQLERVDRLSQGSESTGEGGLNNEASAHAYSTFPLYNSPQMTPEPSLQQQAAISRLVGLPFVCLVEDPRAGSRFVCQLRSGQKVRAVELEEIFNAGLMVDAMEGKGAASRQTLGTEEETQLHHELLAQAERAFGVAIEDACTIWLTMERTEYARWDERPRVKWLRPRVN
jgi:hypothetical protein